MDESESRIQLDALRLESVNVRTSDDLVRHQRNIDEQLQAALAEEAEAEKAEQSYDKNARLKQMGGVAFVVLLLGAVV